MKSNPELNDELKKHCKVLFDKPAGDVFKVPENYFEQLSTEISKQTILNDAMMKENFSVPGNYFTRLPDVVLEKVKTEKPKSNHLVRYLITATSVAAAAVLFFVLTLTPDQNITLSHLAFQRSGNSKFIITKAAVHQYINNEVNTIDENFIASNLEQLQQMSSNEISNIPTSDDLNLEAYDGMLADANEVDMNLLIQSITTN